MIPSAFPRRRPCQPLLKQGHPQGFNQGFNRGRRKGVAVIYTALLMVALMGIAAVSIDLGFLYRRHAEVQQACDSAALAGAWQLANFQGTTNAYNQAYYYAGLPENGKYVYGVKGCNIAITYPAKDEDGVQQNNWFRVDISRPEPTFFGIFAQGKSSYKVGAYAVAIYTTLAPMTINGLGTYGTAPGPVNLSVFGPNGLYANGDCYSTQYLDANKTQKNPLYNGLGYDFLINVPATFKSTTMEIFDPDCYNAGGVADAAYPSRIDELRNPDGSTGSQSDGTTTKYSLYWDNNTPANPNDDVLIGSKSYGNDSSTDMKWNSVFTFNRTTYPTGNFRMNVTSTAGSSENGFDLRIGPTRTGSQAFDPNNGSVINADGHLPINFNTSGQVKIALGTVPIQAAGGQLEIRKFDTDVGSTSVTYTCSTLPGQSWSGKLSGNGQFVTDSLFVPTSYTTAGIWYATYNAGLQDTSVWDMSYSGYGPGRPGSIKLIR